MKDYNDACLAGLLPFPLPEVHKYSRGKTIVVAGSARYSGAAALAAHASQYAGAGYTEVFTAPSAVPVIQSYRPSLVVHSWEKAAASMSSQHSSKHPCAYVIGCGIDENDQEVARLVYTILEQTEAPVLVDGGALPLMAANEGLAVCKKRHQKGLATVFTPHVGEAHRMVGASEEEVLEIEDLARRISSTWKVVSVVKGSDVAIAQQDDVYKVIEGSSVLAKAGTGDVLAGVIGALLAQGLDVVDACVLGATLHAKAGNKAAQALTSISATAEDVIAAIPAAIKELSQQVDG